MDDGGRSDQSVDIASRPKRGDAAPFEGDPIGDGQDPVGVVAA